MAGNAHPPRKRKRLTIIPHTGMTVATDVGDADDIHPKNKANVGDRLAR